MLPFSGAAARHKYWSPLSPVATNMAQMSTSRTVAKNLRLAAGCSWRTHPKVYKNGDEGGTLESHFQLAEPIGTKTAPRFSKKLRKLVMINSRATITVTIQGSSQRSPRP